MTGLHGGNRLHPVGDEGLFLINEFGMRGWRLHVPDATVRKLPVLASKKNTPRMAGRVGTSLPRWVTCLRLAGSPRSAARRIAALRPDSAS
jgi:hypothetical protein